MVSKALRRTLGGFKEASADMGCGTGHEGNTRHRVNSYSTVVEYPTPVGIPTLVGILTISGSYSTVVE